MRERLIRTQKLRSARYEQFEDRLALSAQAVASLAHSEIEALSAKQYTADFYLSDTIERIESTADRIDSLLAQAHQRTGVDFVHETYGFHGSRQTVAVIDTGVAYDHLALGGGFGATSRVVGGWDFAENDADPYDDGPAGFHGTHVAGIVASQDEQHRGVASGVDIVALRVFDDNGAGSFGWVEQALQWVHEHRESFENPITTVNLSLGAEWNSESIPRWATLEDEFAQLKEDGIFVSVAAGNSYANHNTAGLSYPAVSPDVVPISSVDANGQFSHFSQRHERVLAAPGARITSTVPDHVFGADGTPNDFGAASGTSMAAPYAAGVAVLVREAMEFVGHQQITQDTIYQHLRDTADVFFDAATNADYYRINVEAALQSIMPDDDFGSTWQTAHGLGSLSDQLTFRGLVGTQYDQDVFTFTAAATGTVDLTVQASHDLVVSAQTLNGAATGDDAILTFDVVSGQSYSISLGTHAGIGYYDAQLHLTPRIETIDLGELQFAKLDSQAIAGETWFQFTASRDGILTADLVSAQEGVDIEFYDESMTRLAEGGATARGERIDHRVSSGATYLLRVRGGSEAELRLVNLVTAEGGDVSLAGTAAADSVVIHAQLGSFSINGVAYTATELGLTSFSTLTVDTGDGADSLRYYGTESADEVVIRTGELRATSSGLRLVATGLVDTYIHGQGGQDRATWYDSAGDDLFVTRLGEYSYMRGEGTFAMITGFEHADVHALGGGSDRADWYDSAGDDLFVTRLGEYSYLRGGGTFVRGFGFESSEAYATLGGNDRADWYDSAGDDHFVARLGKYSSMRGNGSYAMAQGFEYMEAHANAGGRDRVEWYDSAGNDLFVTRLGDYSYMRGAGALVLAKGFEHAEAHATNGGYDRADWYDSNGNDLFVTRLGEYSYMRGAGVLVVANGFDYTEAYATAGGNDRADWYDSAGDDLFVTRLGEYSYMRGAGTFVVAKGFEYTEAYATMGGRDRADWYDSAADDLFVTRLGDYSYMKGGGYTSLAKGFEYGEAYAVMGGVDRAEWFDSAGDDLFVTRLGDYSYMRGAGVTSLAKGFEHSEAFSLKGGTDRAQYLDSLGDDLFESRLGEYSSIRGSGQVSIARKFAHTEAKAGRGGTDTAIVSGEAGRASLFADRDFAVARVGSSSSRIENFDLVEYHADASEQAEAEVLAIDFILEEIAGL